MKKILLSCVLTLVCVYNSNAQLFTADSLFKTEAITEDVFQDISIYTQIKNPGNAADYTWTKTEMALPAEWATAVCDPFLCHDTSVTTAQFILDSAAKADMILHFYMPSNSGGYGCTRVIIEDDNSGAKDTVIYCLQVYNTLLNVEVLKTDAVKVYPNPASSSIQIMSASSIQEAQLTDLNGKILKTATVNSNEDIRIETNDLPNGLYLVRVKKPSGQVSSTKVVVNN